MTKPFVAIVMGSENDWAIMKPAQISLEEFGVASEARVLSAHRTPEELVAYIKDAEARGCFAFIAGAGAAAHLAGVVASKTLKPVLGVPIPSKYLGGMDSLLSTVQMPKGMPVATFAIGEAGSANAGIFAVSLLAQSDPVYAQKISDYRKAQAKKILGAKLA